MNTLAQIKTWPTGTAVPSFTGRIVGIKKYYSGTGTHGDWSFQDIEVQDSSGKIVVCLDKREELPTNWQGATVTFQAGEHQNKPCGIYSEDHTPKRNDRNPNPSPYRRIRVTPSAQMYEADGQGGNDQQQPAPRQQGQQGGGPRSEQYNTPTEAYQGERGGNQRQQPPAQQRQQPAPAQNQGGQQQRQPKRADPSEAVLAAKKLAARIGVCKQIAHGAAAENAWKLWEIHGIKTTQEGVGAEASGIFIEMMRKMNHDVFDGLPFVLPASEKKPRRLTDLYDMARAEEVARNQAAHRPAAAAADDAPPEATPEQRAKYERLRQGDSVGGQHQARPDQRPQSMRDDPSSQGYGRPAPAESDTAEADDWRAGMDDDDIPF